MRRLVDPFWKLVAGRQRGAGSNEKQLVVGNFEGDQAGNGRREAMERKTGVGNFEGAQGGNGGGKPRESRQVWVNMSAHR